jgi:hypothetical protein
MPRVAFREARGGEIARRERRLLLLEVLELVLDLVEVLALLLDRLAELGELLLFSLLDVLVLLGLNLPQTTLLGQSTDAHREWGLGR